ncbi:MAG: LamG-like jellyroll fold domain-containing protein [Gemmatimonadota bacterium]
MLADEGSPQIDGCAIYGNGSPTHGAGVVFGNSSTGSIANSVIVGNWGAGISVQGSAPTIAHCTVSGNRASETQWHAGIISIYESSPAVTHTIVWGNEGDPIDVDTNSSIAVDYSDIQGGYAGEGNFEAPPLFLAPGGWDLGGTLEDRTDDVWMNGDYRLQGSSPCMDAGLDEAAGLDLPDHDFDGRGRPIDGEMSGAARFDLGAFEYQPSPDEDGDGLSDAVDPCTDTDEDGICEAAFGAVAFWGLDEGEGSVAHDTSGNGNDGAIFGAQWSAGASGNGLLFAGSVTDYVTAPGRMGDGRTDLSLELWLRTTAATGAILSGANSENGQELLLANPGSLEVRIKGYSWNSQASVADGFLHQVVITRRDLTTNSELRVYLDGELAAHHLWLPGGPLRVAADGLVIGQHQIALGLFDGAKAFSGLLGQLVVYDRALSSSEIESRFLLDRDADGIPDSRDNCPGAHNPAQLDPDADGFGSGTSATTADRSATPTRSTLTPTAWATSAIRRHRSSSTGRIRAAPTAIQTRAARSSRSAPSRQPSTRPWMGRPCRSKREPTTRTSTSRGDRSPFARRPDRTRR